jgi:hypothetical protein
VPDGVLSHPATAGAYRAGGGQEPGVLVIVTILLGDIESVTQTFSSRG